MELARAKELLELHYLSNHTAIKPAGYTTKHITVHEDLFIGGNGVWVEECQMEDTITIISVHCTECDVRMVKEE